MVHLPPERMKALQRGEKLSQDILNKFDREIVGAAACQLRIPLDHPVKMREYAEILAGLATRLEALCRRTDMTPRLLMVEYRMEVRACQWQINEAAKGGWKPVYMAVDNSDS